jgi:adenosine/AMP kinase
MAFSIKFTMTCAVAELDQPPPLGSFRSAQFALQRGNLVNQTREGPRLLGLAHSNSVQVIVAKAETSRSVIGIVDGLSSRAIESEDDKQNRSKLWRDLGYKK